MLPAVPIPAAATETTDEPPPPALPVARPASPQQAPPGAVLPAVLLGAASTVPAGEQPPRQQLVTKPTSAQKKSPSATLSAVPIRATAEATTAGQPAVVSEASPSALASKASSAPVGAGKHPARNRKNTNPLVWVAIGVPAALIGLCVVWAVVGGSSDKVHTKATAENEGLGTKLTRNGGNLYYKPPVTEAEANALSRWLANEGFFKSPGKTLQLKKTGNIYEFRHFGFINDELTNNPKAIALCNEMSWDMSRTLFKGAQVNIHLCDERMNTIRVIAGETAHSDEPSRNPQVVKDYRTAPVGTLIADFLPFQAGTELEYCSDLTVPDGATARTYSVLRHLVDGGIEERRDNRLDSLINGRVVKSMKLDSDGTQLRPSQYRVRDGYVEVSCEIEGGESYWEKILKIGATQGETWEYEGPAGLRVKCTLLRIGEYRQHAAAVIRKESFMKGKPLACHVVWYFKGLGLVKSESGAMEGSVMSANLAHRQMLLRPTLPFSLESLNVDEVVAAKGGQTKPPIAAKTPVAKPHGEHTVTTGLKPESPSPKPEDTAKQPLAVPIKPAGKSPAPDEASQQSARKAVAGLYAERHKSATTLAAKRTLVEEILRKVEETDDPATRFVMLRVARDMAIKAGLFDLAAKTIVERDRGWIIDVIGEGRLVLEAVVKAAQTSAEQSTVVQMAVELQNRAVAVGDFEQAIEFGDIAVKAARASGNSQLVKIVVARNREVKQLRETGAAVTQPAKPEPSSPTTPVSGVSPPTPAPPPATADVSPSPGFQVVWKDKERRFIEIKTTLTNVSATLEMKAHNFGQQNTPGVLPVESALEQAKQQIVDHWRKNVPQYQGKAIKEKKRHDQPTGAVLTRTIEFGIGK